MRLEAPQWSKGSSAALAVETLLTSSVRRRRVWAPHVPSRSACAVHWITCLLLSLSGSLSPPTGPSRANTLSLPSEQSMALARLQSLTGANVSLELPSSLTASSLRGRPGSSAGGTRQVSLIASELPSISGFVMSSQAGSSLGASAPGFPSLRLAGHPPSQADGSQAKQADVAHQPAPTSLQLGHPPRPPTSVQLGHPPRPPTSVQPGHPHHPPTSVQLGHPHRPPTSVQLGAQPAAPTSLQFGAQPTAPTSIAFGAQPTAPTSIAFGAQPTAPTSIAFGAQPTAPTSVQLGGSGSGWAVNLFSSGSSGSGGGAATNTISPFATDALSPFASSAASSVGGPSKDGSGLSSPDGDEGDDAALVDELAAEAAAEDMGGRGAAARVREVSQQLVNIASSLSPDNASMLLQSGFSMVGYVGVLKEVLRERLHARCRNMLVCGRRAMGGWVRGCCAA